MCAISSQVLPHPPSTARAAPVLVTVYSCCMGVVLNITDYVDKGLCNQNFDCSVRYTDMGMFILALVVTLVTVSLATGGMHALPMSSFLCVYTCNL